ncbi:MAG: ABC transporter permease, partial [Acidobacteriota bacterium]|nr:ABC transporter permease [Acidobacteriota bacterium]
MLTLWQDLRFAARVLKKNPGFTAVAVLAVALGVGANTTIFSAVNALMLRPFSFPNTDRLVMAWERGVDGSFQRGSVSPGNYAEWREQTTAFEQLAAYHPQFFNLTEGDQPERLAGARVTPNLFRVLASRAERGRTFTDEEGRPGSEGVVLLRHSLWRERFGADPGIVGRQVQLNGRPLTVVGVAAPEFHGAEWALGMKFWAPLMIKQHLGGGTNNWINARGSHWLEVFGRLKPGVTEEQASAALTSVAARLEAEYPEARNKNVRVLVIE